MRNLIVSLLVGLFTVASLSLPTRAATLADPFTQPERSKPFSVEATANDRYFKAQRYFETLKITKAWDVTTGGQATIAVIDTGAEITHPDLVGRIWTNVREMPGNGIDDDANGYVDDVHGYNFLDNNPYLTDRHGHGTGVASVIAASTNNHIGLAGVNQNAKVMILRALDEAGGGDFTTVASALRYAADNGARVVNMSFGSMTSDSDLESAVNYAQSKNVIIIAAAGNAGSGKLYYPAALPGVISVGSVTKKNRLSKFSNYGKGLDVVAPGEGIYMADRAGGYQTAAGTSFASALVSGVVSLAVAQNPTLSPNETEQLIRTTATKLGGNKSSKKFGYGLVDAFTFVTRLAPHAAIFK